MTTLTPGTGTSAEAHAIGVDAATAIATTLKALADPLRLRMLSFISTSPSGEACVCDIAEVADVSQPTVSHHLRVLRDVGVVLSERRGTWVWYRVSPDFRGTVSTLLESFAPAALEAGRGAHELTGLDDVDATLDRVAAELAGAHPGLRADVVQRTVRESYAALARRAGVRAHLVATTERFARQRLADIERAQRAGSADALSVHGPAERAPHVPQVLFVCVANAGRSQLAAALLQRYAGDRVVVRSAGSTPAGAVHGTVRATLEEIAGPDAAGTAFPKPLTDDAVRAADVVVTMGCGDVCPVLPGVRYEDWVVGDPALASPAGVRAIRDEIDQRVRGLLAEILPEEP
ncbi:metalloregulator ArsR/SmtB family transcription factor [Oerskovia flava]|uniref:metalloregulator ArsR/SmtB family transcription factor n=1 Tax=Oerskovia flava TaxID=2986422 RepID=UPI002240A0F4|nr:metalloregulator ArsR/SmtB family transcription factor [Oerskovia sp. JB1-3-2]